MHNALAGTHTGKVLVQTQACRASDTKSSRGQAQAEQPSRPLVVLDEGQAAEPVSLSLKLAASKGFAPRPGAPQTHWITCACLQSQLYLL